MPNKTLASPHIFGIGSCAFVQMSNICNWQSVGTCGRQPATGSKDITLARDSKQWMAKINPQTANKTILWDRVQSDKGCCNI